MITKLKHLILINKREIALISVLVILALILRVWRINEFAIFLSDQAIDSYAVKNIIEGNFTLLGPRASVGNFFNGPAIYYLMLPFYFVMKLDPLAGTYFQIFLQLATIPFIFLLGKRIGTDMTGYLSAVLFAISPLFIYYSKAAFNSYPALFLSVLIIYLMTFEKKKMWHFLIAGFATGVLVQAHYLLYVYAFFYFIYVVMQKSIKNSLAYFAGCLIGVSPFLLFELRHNFFNVNAIFMHIVNGGGEKIILADRFAQLFTSISQILGYKDVLLGVVVLLTVIFACFTFIRKQNYLWNIFSLCFLACTLSLIIYKGTIQNHYLIGIQPVIVLMLAYFVTTVKTNKTYILLVSFFVIVASLSNVSKNFDVPPEQDGFDLKSQWKAVLLVENEIEKLADNTEWNITQDLQQDNRAMPLRYMISLNKSLSQPLPYDDYSSNNILAVLKRKDKPLDKITTWEYISFGRNYKVIKSYDINSYTDLNILKKD